MNKQNFQLNGVSRHPDLARNVRTKKALGHPRASKCVCRSNSSLTGERQVVPPPLLSACSAHDMSSSQKRKLQCKKNTITEPDCVKKYIKKQFRNCKRQAASAKYREKQKGVPKDPLNELWMFKKTYASAATTLTTCLAPFLNSTTPSQSAKRVSSLPRPTFTPGVM